MNTLLQDLFDSTECPPVVSIKFMLRDCWQVKLRSEQDCQQAYRSVNTFHGVHQSHMGHSVVYIVMKHMLLSLLLTSFPLCQRFEILFLCIL